MSLGATVLRLDPLGGGENEGIMAGYDVAGRSAIVTGAASGIGKATALLLAANGAEIVVVDLKKEPVDAVVAEITAAGGTAIGLVGDVTDPQLAVAAVAEANALAPLRIAVNNAGIGGEQATIGDYTLEGWRHVIEVNLNSVMYGLKAQLPAMAENGGGSIVNMASILGSVGFAMSSAYVTAKHGLLGLTQNAALEYAAHKVRVTAVGPGFIPHPARGWCARRRHPGLPGRQHALGRLGTPRRLRRSSPSWPAMRRASSPAATTWSTAGTRRSRRPDARRFLAPVVTGGGHTSGKG